MEYDLTKPWLTLDPWQKKVLETKGNIVLRSTRQGGKSTVISILAAEEAIKNPNFFILIGAYVVDQAQFIFRKIHEYILAKYPKSLDKKHRVTLNFMQLKNGSKILCRPVGDTGEGMRGPTANIVIVDEAAFVPERAWSAITPIISVTKGRMILLSTPKNKKGYFYDSFSDESYTKFHIKATDCPRHTEEFLKREAERMTKMQFACEYLAEFMDEYMALFTEKWIEKVCIAERKESGFNCTLGIDVSRYGIKDTTFEVFETIDKNVSQIGNISINQTSGPEIESKIVELKEKYRFDRKSIGFDSAGVGGGTYDYIMKFNEELKRCVVALDNAKRPIDRDGKQKALLKEHMYKWVIVMGESGKLKLLNDDKVKQSLRSMQYEFQTNGNMKIWGTYDDICEGIVRGVWMAKNKDLNIFIY